MPIRNYTLKKGVDMKSVLSVLVMILLSGCFFSVVNPGERGVKVTLGEASPAIFPEGLVWKYPLISYVERLTVKQITGEFDAACFSSDLQAVNIHLKVLYRMPEESTLKVFREYSGDPFKALIVPRIQEALKEVTALETAEGIAKKREEVKTKTLLATREKLGSIMTVEDIVIENIDLSDQLTSAIEQKMVQEQEAAKAKFIK
jgi:prohibitin 2